jgi:hypothetical protein
LIASRAAISLPAGLAGMRTAAGWRLDHDLRQQFRLRGNEIARHIALSTAYTLAPNLPSRLGLLDAVADEDRGRLAEPGGQGEQFCGGLADRRHWRGRRGRKPQP